GSRWRLSPTDQCLSAGRTYRGQRDALRHSCGLAWSSRRSSGASRKFAALAVALVTPPVSTAPAAFRFRGSLLTICSGVPRRGLPAGHNLRRCATRLLGSPGHAGPRRRCVALRRALANVGHHSVGPYAACLHSATVTSVWPISPKRVRVGPMTDRASNLTRSFSPLTVSKSANPPAKGARERGLALLALFHAYSRFYASLSLGKRRNSARFLSLALYPCVVALLP